MKYSITTLLLLLAFGICAAASAGVDVWTPIGPQGTLLSSVVTDPSSNTRLYATASNDLYRSNDSGASWTRVTPPQPLIPTDCGISLPVVQSDGAVYVSSCHGLYKSVDGGISWTQQGLPNAAPVGDPTNAMVLYAPASPNGISSTLYKTTNGGMNWLPIQTNLPVNTFIQILVDGTLPTRLYAISQNSVYRSLDSGVTWNPINTGLPSTTLYSLALSGSTLFVGMGGFGVYRTVDNGTSWTPANNGISTQDITMVRAGTGGTLYARAGPINTVQFFRSSDGGANWLPTGVLDTRADDFTVSRQSDAILYAATAQGFATSSDGGVSWAFPPTDGLPNAAVDGLYIDALNPSVLYANVGVNGYKSVDRGADWSPLTLPDGSPVQAIAISPTHSGTVYGESCLETPPGACQIYRSTNFGVDWGAPILSLVRARFDFMLEAPDVTGRLYAIGRQFDPAGSAAPLVLRSDDDGAHWNSGGTGLPGAVTAVAMMPNNSSVLYAGAGNSVYKTTNGGALWVNASGGLPQANVNALAVGTVFAGLGNYQSAPALYGLYRSDDGGTTWGPRNPAFVNLAVKALAIDPHNPSNVYAGTGNFTAGGGLYRSTDGGTTFRPINNGLNNPVSLSVNAIAVDPADGRNLYIGTNGGAFALTIDQYDSFVPVIEFYNYNLDHYFMASETQADVPALDSGAFAGWTRTGQTFKAYPQPTGAAQPVCRFYIPPQHGDSHFYSASTSECAAVLDASTNPANPAYSLYSGYKYETAASFYVDVPTNGSCPPGEASVYRLWNKRFDSNHRYTTDPAIRDAMVAKGYVLEGAVMCALL